MASMASSCGGAIARPRVSEGASRQCTRMLGYSVGERRGASRARARAGGEEAAPEVAQPRRLSKKAKKRVERDGPSERELRDSEGSIAAESLGRSSDRKTPRWNKMERMSMNEFIDGLRSKAFEHIEMWEDKDPSYIPQLRPGWNGRRALVHQSNGSKRWVEMPDYPWWDVEKIAYDLVYERQIDVSWHKPPTKAELSGTDLALVAVGGGIFLIVSIYLGLIKRKGLPMDQFQAAEFGQSRSEARKEGKTETRFSDVAGLDSIIGELQEVVSFLQGPERFNKVGARPPKGLLLEGPPGTGKTLIAKAIAGEAGVPFYSMTGSEFVEIIVGVGAARVRSFGEFSVFPGAACDDSGFFKLKFHPSQAESCLWSCNHLTMAEVRDLFKRARVNAPCIIFVDEIDALGGKRAPAVFRGNEEREQTLNQLLTEMDGFSSDTGVIFVGATNRADLLDPALTRPGRFDRKVTVRKPGANARQKILQIHASKTRVSDNVDLFQLANDLPGFNGADLSNLVNEAALVAIRRNADAIEQQDFYWAIDRIVDGAHRSRLPREGVAISRVTVYEAGKAVAACLLRRQNGLLERIERVSVVPRTDEMSRTVLERRQDEDFTFPTRSRLFDRMQMMLAGRAAEEVVFGTASTLADRDLLYSSQLARMVVTSFSLDDKVGFTSYVDKLALSQRSNGALAELFPQSNADTDRYATKEPSDKERERVDERVQAIVKEHYESVRQLLYRHREPLRAVSDALYERDQIEGQDVEQLLADSEQPVERESSAAMAGA